MMKKPHADQRTEASAQNSANAAMLIKSRYLIYFVFQYYPTL